ncbi:MAG: 4'-phosphopantetheinyl transferase superfamily protein [Bacteroidales bacterium]|nr:4'-phosphopantetheinyl transferase superfamily protein [Bacteroidales bacterium]
MPLFSLENNLGVWKVEESFNELYSGLENKKLYESGLSKVSSEHRRLEWIAVRRLLKEMLHFEASIAYYENGAPYLPDMPYHISISHTKGYVAVFLHEEKTVGVDIERYSDRVLRLARKFIDFEKEYISEEKKTIHLLLHWSAKESLYKILGEKEVVFKTQLSVKPFEPLQFGWFRIEAQTGKCRSVFQVNYKVENDFVLTSIEA